MPDRVDESVSFRSRTLQYVNHYDDGRRRVSIAAATRGGERIAADFVVHTPPSQESLNIVVPWSATRFQLNCKENTLPCEGSLTVGARRYALTPSECHGVQDFGRGMWPYRSWWNWGAGTGVQNGRRIGVNVGAKWTTGTGINENGLCVDGRLYKIMEDLRWDYDPSDWMRPWRVRAEQSAMVDLTLEPILAHHASTGFGPLRSGGVCCFGRWHGTIRFDGEALPIHDLIGWAEEFEHRW
jgi:hypothetical protein